jgi:hypothetical protein
MKTELSRFPRHRGVALVLAVVLVQTVVHLANWFTVRTPALDVNHEGSPFTAVSALTVGLAAGSSAVAVLTRAVPARLGVPLAGLLAFLALDEWFRLHERIVWHALRLLGLPGSWDSVVWPLLYLPLTGSVALLVLLVARRAGSPLAGLLQGGLVLLVLAVGLEVASAPFSTETTADGLVHALEGAVEEACELGGWGLLALGSARLAAPGRATRRPTPERATGSGPEPVAVPAPPA